MAFTPIPIGSLAWGAPVNSALTDQDTRISALQSGVEAPEDQGLLAAPYDIALSSAAQLPTSGTIYMVALNIRTPATASSLVLPSFTSGTGLVAGQNWAGLYNQAGTRIGLTADQTTAWATTGVKTMAITPVALAAGRYYVAFLTNAASTPGFLRSLSVASLPEIPNLGYNATDARWATGPTAQTTLPASITMASRTPLGLTYWAGIA